MISFLLCLAILVGGYFVYGKIVDNTFGPDDRETPAVRINDGVDYVVMPQWKLFLVQLLNIAGLGPIFGAMQGALWGPVVFLHWSVSGPRDRNTAGRLYQSGFEAGQGFGIFYYAAYKIERGGRPFSAARRKFF